MPRHSSPWHTGVSVGSGREREEPGCQAREPAECMPASLVLKPRLGGGLPVAHWAAFLETLPASIALQASGQTLCTERCLSQMLLHPFFSRNL